MELETDLMGEGTTVDVELGAESRRLLAKTIADARALLAAAHATRPASPMLRIGTNARLLTTDVERAGADLRVARWVSTPGGHVRLPLYWASGDTSEGGPLDWSVIDFRVDQAAQFGLPVLAVCPPWSPHWLLEHNALPVSEHRAPSTLAGVLRWCEFLEKLLERHPSIVAVETGNEPNLAGFWEPAPDPEAAAFCQWAAATTIRRVDPGVTIVSPGLAPAANRAHGDRRPDDFWAEFCDAIVKIDESFFGAYDAIGVHPYGDPDTAGEDWSIWGQLDEIADYGTPLWATEMGGWSASTRTGDNPASENGQADLIGRQLDELDARHVVEANVYVVRDQPDHDGGRHFGLVRGDGTPKPAAYTVAGWGRP